MPFNVKADRRHEESNRELFIETIDVVVKAWTHPFFSHQGTHYTFPPKGQPHHLFHAAEAPHVVDGEVTKRMLVPKPYQRPYPPIWMMVSSERTARLAAQRGYGAMAEGTPTDDLRDYVDVYAEVRSSHEGRPFTRGEGWAVSRPVHVVEQIQELREVRGIEHMIAFMDAGGLPHDKIMRSLELFGTQVMPAFKAS